MTDGEILRGQYHHQTDKYRKRLQQQITWVHSLLFVLVPFLVIRWQGLQFPEGEIWAPHWPVVSLHNNPFWEHKTPCGHFVTDTESHLWGLCRDNGHLCLCFMWSVWIYGVVFLLKTCSGWSLYLSWLPKINTWLRQTLTSLPSKHWCGHFASWKTPRCLGLNQILRCVSYIWSGMVM